MVTGILIALQINNWNERQIDKKEERVVLTTIATTLRNNLEFFNYATWGYKMFDKSGDIISCLILEKKPVNNTLYRHFHQAILNGASDFSISEIGYTYIKNSNGKIIQNVDLRNEIIKLFEQSYVTGYKRFD